MMKKMVLIIDDEMDSCLLLKAFLTQLKYEVITAFTLKDGLSLLKEQPSVIFLDNNLPDGLGWDHIDYIQNELPDTRLNLISAYPYDSDKLKDKAVTLIPKPFSLSNIKNTLKVA